MIRPATIAKCNVIPWLIIGLIGGLSTLVYAQTAESLIVLDKAWVRAMPPMQSNTAGYLTVFNGGDSAVEVTAVSSLPVARVEMHNSLEVDGMMTMERVRTLTIGPGEKVEFTPGGRHLMIMGLNKMPAAGETVELCLQFNSGGALCTQADVRRTAPEIGDDNESRHQHH